MRYARQFGEARPEARVDIALQHFGGRVDMGIGIVDAETVFHAALLRSRPGSGRSIAGLRRPEQAGSPHHRIASMDCREQFAGRGPASFAAGAADRTAAAEVQSSRAIPVGSRAAAIGGEVNRLVGFDIEGREMLAGLELRPRDDAAGQLEMVSDVEEFDHVRGDSGRAEKGVSARSDNPAAEFQRLRNRAGRGLADFEIRKHDGVADRHCRQEIGISLRTQEMDAMWRSTCTPMAALPRQRPALAPGSASTTKGASTQASATARRAKYTKKACGYVDDRLCRPTTRSRYRAGSESGEMLAFARIPTGAAADKRSILVAPEIREPSRSTAIGADIEIGGATP